MSGAPTLVDPQERPIANGSPRRRMGDSRFGVFMQRYWGPLVAIAGFVGTFAVMQERSSEHSRRLAQLENALGTMATKADLARVEAGVTFLVQREISKADK